MIRLMNQAGLSHKNEVIFLQDNVSIPHSSIVKELSAKKEMTTYYLPPYQSTLASAELIFGAVKKKIRDGSWREQ